LQTCIRVIVPCHDSPTEPLSVIPRDAAQSSAVVSKVHALAVGKL
jgi:hypothetical protein